VASGPPCPQCGAEVQPGWDWCHRCGFDPDNLKPAGWAPTASTAPPPGPAPAPAGPQWSTSDPFGTGTPAPAPSAARSGPGVQQVLSIVVVALVGIAAIGGVTWFVLGRSGSSSDATSTTSSTLPPVVQLVTASGPDGSYVIGLPGTQDRPETVPPLNDGQQGVAWTDDNAFDPAASRGYLVISQAFPHPVTRPDQLRGLDAMAAQFATDPSASSVETTFQGYPARRYAITIDGSPASGLMLVTETHVYMIMSVGATPDDERQAVEGSFRVNPTS
jgi:hypothetical protein